MAKGTLTDEAEAPFTYAGEGERLWTVSYERDGEMVGIEVDLMASQLKRRWTQDGDLGWPMLDSPIAQETRSGHIELRGALLTCGEAAGWLFSSPGTGRYVAAYHGLQPAPLTLTVPGGQVVLDGIEAGVMIWDRGTVTVNAVALQGTPEVAGGELITD